MIELLVYYWFLLAGLVWVASIAVVVKLVREIREAAQEENR